MCARKNERTSNRNKFSSKSFRFNLRKPQLGHSKKQKKEKNDHRDVDDMIWGLMPKIKVYTKKIRKF